MELKNLLWETIRASIEAGEEILEVYNSVIEVEYKDDKSPLTQADKRAHLKIMETLENTDFPILSEEGKEIKFEDRKSWETLWIVDPLDGTKEFIKRNGEFTVNIALVRGHIPVLGVIYVPVDGTLYFGAEDVGSYRFKGNIEDHDGIDSLLSISDRLPQKQERNYLMVGSRSHMSEETQEYFDKVKVEHPDAEILSKGSSLKICMIAEGSADVYPRFAPTMEWDTAAGHAIVRQAGFDVFKTDINEPLQYNKEDLLNPWFIVKKKNA